MNKIAIIILLGNINYSVLRNRMVEDQIIARGIMAGKVINALLQVERHLFVAEEYRPLAYEDHPLPIGQDQTISQPYIVALMTELIEPDTLDKVLEIGTGSGYQAAVLSLLCDSVFTIELIPELARSAAKRLRDLGYDNVSVKCGDGFLGWPEHEPFDKIIITCAPPKIPEPLINQLKMGGILVLPLGVKEQWLLKATKTDKGLKTDTIAPVLFVPMKGKVLEN
ncbi:MAG TPA: protein-L-isoaspartate(D-aspartate) O-methyltransferase [bacterium (Candidatus Stahlbacteria)]|nr:protein-L-isoaspartate(D-aspartate) O-methyltransferase [Candidatus Stahlbacteria bacterium]